MTWRFSLIARCSTGSSRTRAASPLDGALGHSDPQRLRRLASAITTAGERTQVIVLTSNPERFATLREARRIEM